CSTLYRRGDRRFCNHAGARRCARSADRRTEHQSSTNSCAASLRHGEGNRRCQSQSRRARRCRTGRVLSSSLREFSFITEAQMSWIAESYMSKKGVAKGKPGNTHQLTEAKQGKYHYVYGPYAKPV